MTRDSQILLQARGEAGETMTVRQALHHAIDVQRVSARELITPTRADRLRTWWNRLVWRWLRHSLARRLSFRVETCHTEVLRLRVGGKRDLSLVHLASLPTSALWEPLAVDWSAQAGDEIEVTVKFHKSGFFFMNLHGKYLPTMNEVREETARRAEAMRAFHARMKRSPLPTPLKDLLEGIDPTTKETP